MTNRESEETLDNSQNIHNASDGEKQRYDEKPVGFFDSSFASVRNRVFKNWAITTLILCTFILAILSVYWGSLFRVEQNMSSLVVWVVDFDSQVAPYTGTTAVVGPAVVSYAMSLLKPKGTVGWGSLPASDFDYDPIQVRQRVFDQKAWAAVIINPNATALLNDAVNNGNSSYDPMGAAQIIYVEARDETTVDNYIVPQLLSFQSGATSMFGEMWAGQVLQQASTSTTVMNNLIAAPQVVSPAISFSIFNLRPFQPATSTPAVSIGLIYLIIIAFFSFTFYMPHHMTLIKSPGKPILKYWQLIVWRWCATVSAYFFLSLSYSLISLAFQIPFSSSSKSEVMVENPTDAYGKGTFVVYWMLNWVGMTALGLACENVAMFIGQPWTSFWLIFWVITNVATSFYSIDLAPHFYYWGYAWPLHNIVEASRTILFDLHSRIGLNFGILFAWCAVDTALFPFACNFMAWKEMRAIKKAAEGKEK